MSADGRLAPSERRNYKHVFDALRRIYVEEGNKGLFTGFKPTVLKSTIQNVVQLVSYTQIKEFLISNGHMKNNTTCHFLSAYVSGLLYSLAACPVDVIKTRIQSMESNTRTPIYSGVLDALMKTVRTEGVTALWKGFVPLYARNGPHTILLFIFAEKLTYLYRRIIVESPGSDY